ncbi:MAG: L-aspartate oxidase [Coriobacteriales bacterium]|nr:L-aspartate oxidase [Coriobacteriales bacterium]
MRKLQCDVVVVGCGIAGLYAALKLPRSCDVILIAKGDIETCDSMLAQGGIAVMRNEEDYDLYVEDTLKAGHYENRRESVEIMIRNSRDCVNDLISYGARFDRDPQGNLLYTREGAHSRARILYHEDITGREITETLLLQARASHNIRIYENTEMVDLLDDVGPDEKRVCTGISCVQRGGKKLEIYSRFTILATGGIGGIYERSTNYPILTGDGCRIAQKHGVALEHMDYVQIHPTTLYRDTPGRSFLITESARGEGAVLLNSKFERFTDELQPRDVVAKAILDEMKREGSKYVWLSFENVMPEIILSHFKHIYEYCLSRGFDIMKEPIPVVPAQHYFMGGIHVDSNSETTMPRLFAVGETSCTGVHGRNRLASNSLLECLVFARRAAEKITADHTREQRPRVDPSTLSMVMEKHIRASLEEDMPMGDVSTDSVIPDRRQARVELLCKEDGIIAGMAIFARTFELLDPTTKVTPLVRDGDRIRKGQMLATVEGDVRTLLAGERTALNYLQHMSGVATYTRTMADILAEAGSKARLVDTRKTTPGMRIFDKMAVRIGGGGNHRHNLSDAVLLKDNHIEAAGGIREAVRAARERCSFMAKIEVECEDLNMVREAVEEGADVIMLDNMSHAQMKEAIEIIAGRAATEISGNVTRENVESLADLRVDYISSGALTHSSGILDMSMKNLQVLG